MGFAVYVQNTRVRIGAHAASAVLMANALDRYPLLEVCMQRDMCRGVAGLLQYVNPPVFQSIERLHVIGRVGKTDTMWRMIGDWFRLIRSSCIACWMRAGKARLPVFDG